MFDDLKQQASFFLFDALLSFSRFSSFPPKEPNTYVRVRIWFWKASLREKRFSERENFENPAPGKEERKEEEEGGNGPFETDDFCKATFTLLIPPIMNWCSYASSMEKKKKNYEVRRRSGSSLTSGKFCTYFFASLVSNICTLCSNVIIEQQPFDGQISWREVIKFLGEKQGSKVISQGSFDVTIALDWHMCLLIDTLQMTNSEEGRPGVHSNSSNGMPHEMEMEACGNWLH